MVIRGHPAGGLPARRRRVNLRLADKQWQKSLRSPIRSGQALASPMGSGQALAVKENQKQKTKNQPYFPFRSSVFLHIISGHPWLSVAKKFFKKVLDYRVLTGYTSPCGHIVRCAGHGGWCRVKCARGLPAYGGRIKVSGERAMNEEQKTKNFFSVVSVCSVVRGKINSRKVPGKSQNRAGENPNMLCGKT